MRTITYGYNRSLWHDEASLALNIINDVNFFQPLLHNQFAPQFFMYITKLNAMIFGNSELVLRFVPFIFGILSVFMFYFLSKEFLEKKVSIILANALFAVNYHIIYYCQEFKQYSTDVFFFMLVLLILSKIDINKITLKTYILTSVIILGSTMISLPILFVIAGWFVMNILKYRLSVIKNISLYLPIIAIFIVYYIFLLIPAKFNVESAQIHFWDKGYLELNIISMFKMIKSCYNYCFTPNTYLLLILVCSCTGWFFIIKNFKNKAIYLLTFLSFMFVVIASFFNMYPLENRAGLFFTPIVILTVIIPVDRLRWTYFILVLVLISLSSYNVNYIKSFFNPNVFTYKNAREVTKILKEKYEQGDIVIYNIASQPNYEYYTKFFDLNIKDYAVLQLPDVSDSTKRLILNESLSYLKKGKSYIFYIGYDWRLKPELSIIKEYLKSKNIIWQYDVDGSYIVKILW